LKNRQSPWSECLSYFTNTKTVIRCLMKMKITWSAEHRRIENTICTAPVQDCEKSENPEDYLYFQHPRYDIHRRHRNRQVIVINTLEFRTIVLHCHRTSLSYIGLKSLSLLLIQPLNVVLILFTLSS